MIVELRRSLQLSLDDVTEVIKRGIRPELSRSAIHRCMKRHGVNRLEKPGNSPSHQPFETATCGFIHIDLKVLPRLDKKRSYVFVAIDRATRYVVVKMIYRCDAKTINGCLKRFIKQFPHPAHTTLTDNDRVFTDRFAVFKKGKTVGKPTGLHPFDVTCREHSIEHRLIHPATPQTNDMVKRFNRQISDTIQQKVSIMRNSGRNKFHSHQERNAFIYLFVENYNKTRLRCLNSKAPEEEL